MLISYGKLRWIHEKRILNQIDLDEAMEAGYDF